MFADETDEGLRRARQAAIATVDQAEFAVEIYAFHAEQFHFASLDLIFGEALADKRNTGVRAYEAFDHADTGKLHSDVDSGAVRAEKLVKDLARVASAGKNERLASGFFELTMKRMRSL